MNFKFFFPYLIVIEFFIAGTIYLILDPKNWKQWIYWYAGAIINFSVIR